MTSVTADDGVRVGTAPDQSAAPGDDQGAGYLAVRQARTSAGDWAEVGLARVLSELARELQCAPDAGAVMELVVAATVQNVEGCDSAGITLLQQHSMVSAACTDDRARQVAAAQLETGEGPCWDCTVRRETIRSDDLRSDQRWPRLAERAVNAGVLSVLSFELFVESRTLGTLDAWSQRPDAFDAAAESDGLLLASHAAIALSAAGSSLHAALDSRDLIEQAAGVLMQRLAISSAEATAVLGRAAKRSGRPLRDMAGELVETGDAGLVTDPGEPAGPA